MVIRIKIAFCYLFLFLEAETVINFVLSMSYWLRAFHVRLSFCFQFTCNFI